MAAEAARRVAWFLRERVPAHHGLYGVVWSVAGEAGSALAAGPAARWRPGVDTAVRASALTLTLVGMRMLDDVKDLAHDRVHEPDRPLVRGDVSTSELLSAAAGCGVAALALARSLGPVSARRLAVAQAYGIVLWPLDRAVRTHRRGRPSPVLDSALAYPTQVWGSLFLLESAGETGAAPRSRRAFALVPVFASAFLQFEVARKTRSTPPQGAGDYSSVVPWRACAAAIVALGEAAVWGSLAVSAPWKLSGPQRLAAWTPAALSVLPPAVVLGMVRGTRSEPKAALSIALLLGLYLSIPTVAGMARNGTAPEVRRPQ